MNKLVNKKLETIGEAKNGQIVSVLFKDGTVDNKCFEVIGDKNGYALLSRVKKEKGFPNAGHNSIFRTDSDKFTLVLVDEGKGRQQKDYAPVEQSSQDRIELLKKIYFEGPFKNVKTLTDKFQYLISALSPENLYCDGEISRSQAQRKYRDLKALWADCEKELGRKVSESEVWKSFENKTEIR